jgi:amino acid adenylation domain-containing protein
MSESVPHDAVARRKAALSPAKRTLVEQRLRGEQTTTPRHRLLVEAATRPAHCPLSYAQQRLWFIDRMDGTSTQYNMTAVLAFDDQTIDAAALQAAVQAIVARHEVLRTHFVEREGEPAQVIDPVPRIDLPVVDLSRLDHESRHLQVVEELRRERQTPFDLGRGPLLRARLVTLGPQQHLLVRTIHHIACDAWSETVFNHECRVLYDAFRRGRDNPLPPLEVQYADFALWQRRTLQGAAVQEPLSYWRRQLAGMPAMLDLPTTRPRPPRQTFTGEQHRHRLSPARTAQVKALCQAHQATPYMVLLAIFALLLARYTGQDDIVVGSPVASRQDAALESLIGFFVNTLVLRLRVQPHRGFRELLAEVRRTALDAYRHQDVPFERLVEELAPPRRLDTTPLVQVLFGLRNVPTLPESTPVTSASAATTPGEAWARQVAVTKLVAEGEQPVRFDLEVYAWEDEQGIGLQWLYNRDLFDAAFIEQMARHYLRVLDAAAVDPDRAVAQLPLLDADERRTLLATSTGASATLSRETVAEAIEAQVARTPAAPAMIDAEGELSYRQANEQANQLAHELIACGVGPEDLVGVALPRSSRTVIALLAIGKAGAAFLPMDPTSPPARLARLLGAAAPACVLTTRALAERLPSSARLVLVDAPEVAASIARRPITNPDARLRRLCLDHAAYVMFTSGSTGTPKGVVIEHRALATFLDAIQRDVPFGPGDRHVAVTATTFDISILELLAPLCQGATVIVASAADIDNPAAVAALVARHAATSIQATPSYWGLLIRQDQAAWRQTRVLTGGEALPVDTARALLHAGRQVVNLYGPTEATIWAGVQAVADRDIADTAPHTVSIGHPLASYAMYVLDARLEPVPIGVTGELYIAGPALARGYLDAGGLTASRFVASPFDAPGRRMYRTGDLARRRHDGRLDFLGRTDHQVKIRGFRIELGEVESALRAHELVADALVVVQGNGPDTRLAGYVLRADDETERVRSTTASLADWQQLYDATYREGADARFAADFNIVDWVSSYTGAPIPPDEMRQWVDETVAHLRARQPRCVLEIGCGTGLLLTRLAGACERYIGLDFSPFAIAQLEAYARTRPDLAHVELRQGLAHELSFVADGSVDLVVMNSVAQYFPGVDYLLDVLTEAVRVTRDGGQLFVGDVRNHALLRVFHTSLQIEKAAADLTIDELRQKRRESERNEKELLVDLALFEQFARGTPRIARVEPHPKIAPYDNEISRFRYDVLMPIGVRQTAIEPAQWVSWDVRGNWWHEVDRRLREQPGLTLGVRDIPDRRVAASVRAVRALDDGIDDRQRVGELRADCATASGEELGRLVRLAEAHRATWSWRGFGADGLYGFVINPHWREVSAAAPASPSPSRAEYRRHANAPDLHRAAGDLGRILQRHLRDQLPEHLVPASITVLSAWPLTPGGKLDRRALPSPDRVAAATYRAPSTPREELLCAAIAELTGARRVGADDDFFDIGGHSLMAMRVIARVQAACGVVLPVKDFFERRTVAALAARIDELSGAVTPGEVPLERLARTGNLPISLNQEQRLLRRWLATVHNHPVFAFQLTPTVRLRGPIDAATLERALNEIVRRHEALRTGFVSTRRILSSKPIARLLLRLFRTRVVQRRLGRAAARGGLKPTLFRQQIVASAHVPMRVLDLSRLDPGAQAAAMRDLPELQTPLDLATPPLLRAVLVRFAADDHVLVLVVSHLVFDGFSEGVLRRELATLYDAFTRGLASPLPEPGLHYADFAAWERKRFTGARLEQYLAFWQRVLPDFSPLTSPLAVDELWCHRRAATPRFRARTESLVIDGALYATLAQLCPRQDVTWFMLILAALSVLLHHASSRERVCVWTPFANRLRPETQEAIGWFAQMHLLGVACDGDPTFVDLLQRVRELVLGAIAHQDMPLVLLALRQTVTVPGRGVPSTPHISFDLRDLRADAVQQAQPVDEGQSGAEWSPVRDAPTAWGLAVVTVQRRDSIRIVFRYSVDWFTDESARDLLASLRLLLHRIAVAPAERISEWRPMVRRGDT